MKLPVAVHSQPILPCMVPYKMNADMAVILGCDICQDIRNRLEVAQIVPLFFCKKIKKMKNKSIFTYVYVVVVCILILIFIDKKCFIYKNLQCGLL